jgi:hypothetical protein
LFEVGTLYTVRMIEDGVEWTVAEANFPLVGFNSEYEADRIINTASLNFISATPFEQGAAENPFKAVLNETLKS